MNPTSLRSIKLASNLPIDGLKEIIDVTDSLPKNPTGDWLIMPTRRKDGELHTGPRDYNDITELAIHHTAVENGMMENYARYHISKGDAGIAYHIMVFGDQIFQCNDLLALTWHVPSNNFHTVSISVNGDFTKRNLTENERKNLYTAILTVLELFPNIQTIKGHKEFQMPAGRSTSCPGFDMDRLRDDIQTLRTKIEYMKTEAYAQETAYKIANQSLFLYNLMQGKKADGSPTNDGEKLWARNMLLQLSPFMKDKGLL